LQLSDLAMILCGTAAWYVRIVASVKLNFGFVYKMGVLSGYRSIIRLVGPRFDDLLLVICP
jgi:hypothetical protein